MKLGASGAVASCAGARFEREAIPVVPVDTVGAGDAFVAGYLGARLTGEDPAACLDRGVRYGALACAHPGDWEGTPTPADLAWLDDPEPVRR